MQPLVYFRTEAPLITRAYYITRYACHRVTITSRIAQMVFLSISNHFIAHRKQETVAPEDTVLQAVKTRHRAARGAGRGVPCH